MINTTNTLCIDQLAVMASIGVHNWEKQCLQRLIFDLKLKYTNVFCINDTKTLVYIDYIQISQIIFNIVNKKHFSLIEDIAEIVSKTIMDNFSIILQIKITVSKPGAIYNARNVRIYMKRNKLNNSKRLKLYVGWK